MHRRIHKNPKKWLNKKNAGENTGLTPSPTPNPLSWYPATPVEQEAKSPAVTSPDPHPAPLGAAGAWAILLASFVFLAGISLIVFTFNEAFKLFNQPINITVQVKPGQLVDVQATVNALAALVGRILLLALMAAFGSLVATRGIRLFESCLGRPITKRK